MPDTSVPVSDRSPSHPALLAGLHDSGALPSRMLDEYLADLEQLQRENRTSIALRNALALPHIAVALSDAQLRSSREQYERWCSEWLRGAETVSPDALYERWQSLGTREQDGDVPLPELRQLRLRRLVRPVRAPAGRQAVSQDSQAEKADAATCAALLGAARRWYAARGSRDATVQFNLGRLAVLR